MTGESNTVARPVQPRKLRVGMLVLGGLLLIVAAFAVYSFHAWRAAVADDPMTTQRSITKAVDSIAVTPGETPQIATVKDAAKLTSSALAHTAENGDVLLIYDKAGRIIVYRPTVHKIVAMLSVEPPGSAAVASQQNTGTKTQP